ncbi:hypothetical protein, partial [Paraburkholderia sp. SIMBA_030]|uniref:hypothetical protein n=1 Tax=Paraburkholderia sp. SIMBA_030 TaxID=3085773 RepID=UPI00397D588D
MNAGAAFETSFETSFEASLQSRAAQPIIEPRAARRSAASRLFRRKAHNCTWYCAASRRTLYVSLA